ncbi:benzoylsuccinyl-CoA thiolase [Nocardioides sp. MAH-18]|uniref:Benzoylsuccinyl-CoA thiolase n=1 Tax=Nocardioides agri TaxID=2682843 RepID=A0A6L6XPI3_9ACTN|nr:MULTISPECIES: OB-fold domain-containing protein [unclassified Nocardioides]MBA2954178.1 OB-fold domain-containing protein [Nocardioides sp. CGMCC 1.13656]MVQ49040.1 benzoylsuccinyl-CoA thiolase [Nocardioides sp. MAH-18]
MTATPAIEGWFTTGPESALVGSRCTTCETVFFPPLHQASGPGFCRNPACAGEEFAETRLSRRGTVWSYTDAQYQPPPPYVPRSDPYEPFALAAVELPEGLVVLGQVAEGYGVADLRVGAEAELVVETLYADESGERTVWRWKPVVEMGEEADQ